MLLFLDISTGELFLIALAILVLFGPKSLPLFLQNIGRFLFQVKQAKTEVEETIWKNTSQIQAHFEKQRKSIQNHIEVEEKKEIVSEEKKEAQ